jgi:hypothetical protein
MRFRFFMSSPQGALELSPEDLEQPFLLSPSEKHPSLTLKDYFGALQKFILSHDGAILFSALSKQNLQHIDVADISEVVISSEKHGAYYHIASIALRGLEKEVRFAITTALSEPAKISLEKEFFIMRQLIGLSPEFLPEIYSRETVTWSTESGAEEFVMMLGEWLDGYHEWHLNDNPESGKRQIQLWDYDQGYRFLSKAESHEILRQVAYILTYYYDPASFCEIYPWHHGAGDFVVKAESGALSVKLITARQYEPLVHFDRVKEADHLVAAIHFLLNLSLRVRLDRLDGVAGPAWIDDSAVHAAVEGFFAGLQATSATNRLLLGSLSGFLEILQSFDAQEILDMYESLLHIYAEEDQDDFRLIQAKLAEHASLLHTVLQDYSLGKT